MNRILKNRVTACVLVLIIVALGIVIADDVTVQQGSMYVDDNLAVDGDLVVLGIGIGLYGNLEVWENGKIGLYSKPDAYFDDVTIYGKLDVDGQIDPEWVQYDRQTRNEVVESVKKTVPPEKQGGAVQFFNQETKRMEVYIPIEGKFYDMQGNLLYTLPNVVNPTAKYETIFRLDSRSGELKTRPEAVRDRYLIKRGFALDRKTGRFINKETGDEVLKEEALEFYVASEGNFYDMDGKFLRSEEKE